MAVKFPYGWRCACIMALLGVRRLGFELESLTGEMLACGINSACPEEKHARHGSGVSVRLSPMRFDHKINSGRAFQRSRRAPVQPFPRVLFRKFYLSPTAGEWVPAFACCRVPPIAGIPSHPPSRMWSGLMFRGSSHFTRVFKRSQGPRLALRCGDSRLARADCWEGDAGREAKALRASTPSRRTVKRRLWPRPPEPE